MPKPITSKELSKIVRMVRNWPKDMPLTWEAICAGSKELLGHTPTRQALSGKPVVATAYKAQKEARRIDKSKFQGVPRPANMVAAMKIIQQQRGEIAQLEKTVTMMAEMANRFIYNASLKGLSRSELEKPLKPLNTKPAKSDEKVVQMGRRGKK